MEVYVIRHGQTATNACKGMVGRKQEYSLTEKGEEQAKKARKIVSEIDYDFVICSPLSRTKRTCELVNAKNKEIIYDERIIERDCGEMEGKPKESFDYPHYWNYNYEFDIKGMMPIKEFIKTVWNFLDEIILKYPDKRILIVTHNGVCRAIGAYFNGIPIDGNLSIYAHDNCEIKCYKDT
jgi:broad specificity phosphatase PhoE